MYSCKVRVVFLLSLSVDTYEQKRFFHDDLGLPKYREALHVELHPIGTLVEQGNGSFPFRQST
jgi:hypothetical protein